jgi:hypothetical protein
MPTPSRLQRLKERRLVQWGLGLALFVVLLLLWGFRGVGIAFGALFLIDAVLLKLGILKPGGSFLGSETPLGTLLVGVGFWGFVSGDMGSSELPSSPAEVVLLFMAMCMPVGFWIEGKARWGKRKRKAKD